METDPEEVIDLVCRRFPVLDALADGPRGVTELAAAADSSRSTANRAVRELEDAGLVERSSEGGYVLTLTGRLLTDRYREFACETGGIVAADPVLSRLPADCEVDPALFAGCDVETASGPAPYQPRERLLAATRRARRYRIAVPALDDPRHLGAWHELAVSDGGRIELLVPPDLFEELRTEFPRRLAAMADTGRATVRVGDVPPFGLALSETGEDATALLAAFEDGAMTAVLENDADDAVRHARDRLDGLAADARDRTAQLREADGAVEAGPSTTVDRGRTSASRTADGGSAADVAGSQPETPLVRGSAPADPRERGETLVRAAAIARGQDDYETARERLEAALEAFREVGATEKALETADALVGLCESRENAGAALEYCRQAVEIAETADLSERASGLRERCRRLEATGTGS